MIPPPRYRCRTADLGFPLHLGMTFCQVEQTDPSDGGRFAAPRPPVDRSLRIGTTVMTGRDVRAKSLSVAHGATVAVHPTDVEIAAGELVALLGPAGCGKTTLLRTLAGFLAPTLGRVLIGGVDVTDRPPERRPTVLVPVEPTLFPRMTVADNVAFGLEARGLARATRIARAEALLDLVGLAGAGPRRPAELDEIARRRVALARALAVEPALLLLDDPFTALLPEHRRAQRDLLRHLRDRTAATILLATHDREDALAVGDRVAAMNAGRIEQIDTPDRLWSAPATAFVARLLGDVNVVPGRITGRRDDRIEVATAIGPLRATARGRPAIGDAVEVMIRPERLAPDAEAGEPGDPEIEDVNRIRADLVGRTLEGPTVAYDFAVGDVRLTLRRPNLGLRGLLLASLHPLVVHPDDVLVFPVAAPGGGDG